MAAHGTNLMKTFLTFFFCLVEIFVFGQSYHGTFTGNLIGNADSATSANFQSTGAIGFLGIGSAGQFTVTGLSPFLLGAPNLGTTNTFTGANTFSNPTNSFAGDGSKLTGVNTNLMVSNYQYPASVGVSNWFDGTYFVSSNLDGSVFEKYNPATHSGYTTNKLTHDFESLSVGSRYYSGGVTACESVALDWGS